MSNRNQDEKDDEVLSKLLPGDIELGDDAVENALANQRRRVKNITFKQVLLLGLATVTVFQGLRWLTKTVNPLNNGSAPNGHLYGDHELVEWPFLAVPHSENAPHHPPNTPHHGPHGHKRILNGKVAEKIFLRVPDNESAIKTSKHFAGKPHMAGTDGDYDTAIDFLHLLQKELGISSDKEPIFKAGSEESRNSTLNIPKLTKPAAWVDTYYPVLNTPVNHSIEILDDSEESVIWTAQLEEVADSEEDPDAQKYAEAIPAFHGLSRGGEVQGKLVYVNYGRKEDYDALEEQGVNLTGAIAIARYGGNFRGLKVKGAQERGAIGCLIYSDIRDDGSVRYHNGYAAYPHGPARNPTSVQRGSVQFLSMYPGDPTTPGTPAYEDSNRTEGENIPSIPSLPISWNTASRLLQEIEIDGKNRTIKLVNNVDTKVTPIWNTMAVIPGHIKDEVVVMGNHRDAWVMGATDPTSGTVSTYEVVRGLGVLLRKGWKPLRTILIASWDAEEYGLIGSTEWGEDFPEWIQNHVVAYLNLDSSVSGSRLGLSASPSLAHLVRDAAIDIPHPTDANRTLWQARLDKGHLHGGVDEEAMRVWEEQYGAPLIDEEDLDSEDELLVKVKGGSRVTMQGEVVKTMSTGVRPVGSGSDYTVFLQRLGVSITNFGFQSTLSDPVYHYHSVFDSHPWQEKYGDPGFHRHVAIAKLLGLQLLRLADSVILPINTTQYAVELHEYLDKVETIAKESSLNTDFSKLRNSISNLSDASAELDAAKKDAEWHLRMIIRKIFKHKHGHFSSAMRKVHRFFKKIAKKLGLKFGSCPKHSAERLNGHPENDLEKKGTIHEGLAVGKIKEQNAQLPRQFQHFPRHHDTHGGGKFMSSHHHLPKIPGKVLKKLKKAVKRVQTANQKLVSFERGFLHEAGLKDREWYKHLGVAPGKWLGYGATTLPGITEALTIEKNVTLAQEEADRLQELIDDLVDSLKA